MHRAVRPGPDMTGPVRSSAGMVSGPRDHPRPRHKVFNRRRPAARNRCQLRDLCRFCCFLPFFRRFAFRRCPPLVWSCCLADRFLSLHPAIRPARSRARACTLAGSNLAFRSDSLDFSAGARPCESFRSSPILVAVPMYSGSHDRFRQRMPIGLG